MGVNPNIPMHIILDEETSLLDSTRFQNKLRELAKQVADPSLELSVYRIGKVIYEPTASTIVSTGVGTPRARCDLRSAFERLAAHYENRGIKDPEALLFLHSEPVAGWEEARRKLIKLNFMIGVYWLSYQPVSQLQSEGLASTFAQICTIGPDGNLLFKIIEPSATGKPEWMNDAFSKLEARLKARQRPVVKPGQPLSQSTAAAAPGFRQPVSGSASAKQPVQAHMSPPGPSETSLVPPKPQRAKDSDGASSASGAVMLPAKQKGEEVSTAASSLETGASSGRYESAPSLLVASKPAATKAAAGSEDVAASEPGPMPTTNEVNTSSELPQPRPDSAGQVSPSEVKVADAGGPAPAAAKEVKAPPKPIQPAQWVIKEPPEELGDRKPHTMTDSRPETAAGWFVAGASRRGRLHENEGTFREDAFAIENEGGWHLIAVADGAGSHHLSRVGSNLAVKTAIEVLTAIVRTEPPSKSTIRSALQDALAGAWKALFEEARGRNVDFRDLSTTLLLLGYYPSRNLLGVAQIGDGLLAAQLGDGTIGLLGKPESGEYSGQTYFLTNYKAEELGAKVETPELPQPAKLFFVMTDGVSDDLYPPLERLPGLTKPMPTIMAAANPEQALLDLISYQRAASFDDRTLVVLCQPARLAAPAAPQTPVAPPPVPGEAALSAQPNAVEPSGPTERASESHDDGAATKAPAAAA